jgi:hypothetical protein
MYVRLIPAVIILTGSLAMAAAPPPKGKAAKAAKLDLGMPKTYDALPSGSDIEKPKEKSAQQAPTTTATNAEYTVVKVQHGKAFTRTPEGAKPSTAFDAVPTEGNPPTTDKFTTVVRVRCTQKTNAPIDVVILDPRNDTLMQASGEVFFRGQKEMEVDYTVDWERTQLPRGTGAYQVLIRIAGAPLGTFPLKIADPPPKK